MARIKAKQITRNKSGYNRRELYAMVCYHYPQYTLQDVARLPARDVRLLMKIAQKQEASRMHNLTLIAAAPHSKKQVNVKKLLEHFKKQASN